MYDLYADLLKSIEERAEREFDDICVEEAIEARLNAIDALCAERGVIDLDVAANASRVVHSGKSPDEVARNTRAEAKRKEAETLREEAATIELEAQEKIAELESTREAVRTLDFSNAGGESVDVDGGDAEEVVTMVSTSSWGSEEDAAARYASSESERSESEEEDDASGRLCRALDAVDAASREALARNFSAVSVVTLSREMTRAREAAGVEDLRRMDSEESESEDAGESRAARLELSRARYRAKVAEAEAVILRREADEAKKRCVETYGEEGRAW